MQNIRKTIKFSDLVWGLAAISALVVFGVLQVAFSNLVESLPGSERQIVKSTLPLPSKWSYVAPAQIHNAPIVVAGLVILRTDDSLIALKAETGEPRWTVPAGAFSGPSTIIAVQDNTIVFASDGDSKVQAVDLQNGTVLWSREPYNPFGDIRAIATDRQRVYVGLGRASNPLQAYDLKSGKPIWVTEPLVPLSDSAQALAVNGNDLFAVVESNLFLLDSRTGGVKRTIPEFYQGGDIHLGNQVALTWFSASLLVKDIQTGNRVWQFSKRPNFFNIIGDRVYLSSDCCALHALEFRTGQLLWERPLPLLTGSEVVTVGNTGYVLLYDGSILAFDTVTGADQGKLETTPHSVGINVPDRGLGTDGTSLYATFGDNKVFAFGP